MTNANTTNNFITGIFSILIIDIFIFIIGIAILAFLLRGNFIGLSSMFMIHLIGIYQYIYVIPIIIWQLIKGNKKFTYGFLSGSLSTSSIGIVTTINFMESIGF